MKWDLWRAVCDLAERQHGLVSTRQLAALGVGRKTVERALERNVLARVRQDVVAVRGAPLSPWRDVMAACLAVPGSVASHRTAARLHRLPGFLPGPVDVTVFGRTPPRRQGIRGHRSWIASDDVTAVDNIPVTTAAPHVGRRGSAGRQKSAGTTDRRSGAAQSGVLRGSRCMPTTARQFRSGRCTPAPPSPRRSHEGRLPPGTTLASASASREGSRTSYPIPTRRRRLSARAGFRVARSTCGPRNRWVGAPPGARCLRQRPPPRSPVPTGGVDGASSDLAHRPGAPHPCSRRGFVAMMRQRVGQDCEEGGLSARGKRRRRRRPHPRRSGRPRTGRTSGSAPAAAAPTRRRTR